ncbi:hypothetical protein D0Y65_018673 [Glycine soja]|uniref:Uncharacterized protein n=1 Tax=Glycine soja TaxID=3848 RepID=A0A445K044_GLYSO|nr:hypothetical protein D0Y65_018673 [Glycine soja]
MMTYNNNNNNNNNNNQFIVEGASLTRPPGFIGEDYPYCINYEGTKDVQLRKPATLTHQYESFSMKEGEYADDMFGRVQVLLNGLKALGHTFTKGQINLKIQDSFPKVWKPKTSHPGS